MGTTPVLQLPYPELNDPANVPVDMKELADRLEVVIGTSPAPPVTDPSVDAVITTYPMGMSLTGISAAAGANWPTKGASSLATFRRNDALAAGVGGYQLLSRWSVLAGADQIGAYWYRAGASSGWGPWIILGGDTGWLDGTTTGLIMVVNASTATLTGSRIRVSAGRAQLWLGITLKVGSNAPNDMNIANITVGTLVAPYRPTVECGLPSGSSGRFCNWVVTPSGAVVIASIGGTDALASGDVLSCAGSFVI